MESQGPAAPAGLCSAPTPTEKAPAREGAWQRAKPLRRGQQTPAAAGPTHTHTPTPVYQKALTVIKNLL